eukprot:sb/3476205/
MLIIILKPYLFPVHISDDTGTYTDTSKQPIRTRYLGHVIGYQGYRYLILISDLPTGCSADSVPSLTTPLTTPVNPGYSFTEPCQKGSFPAVCSYMCYYGGEWRESFIQIGGNYGNYTDI